MLAGSTAFRCFQIWTVWQRICNLDISVLRNPKLNFGSYQKPFNCVLNRLRMEPAKYDRLQMFYFSLRTPLNGRGSAFWSMKRPVPVSRLTHLSVCGLCTWLRSRTSPLRCPSPLGGFVAIMIHLLSSEIKT